MGSEHTVSVSWTRKFLSDIDLNWRKFIRKSSDLISEDAAMDSQNNLAQKVRYMQYVNDIPDLRVELG
eukprot:4189385-Amphidinium_carterae.2